MMALKRNKNGQFIISSLAEAKRALEMLERLQAEIAELEREHGIDEMKVDTVELKKAATHFLADKGTESLKYGKGRIAKLVRAVNQKKWIGTKAELAEGGYGPEVKSLRSLVNKDTWLLITKRIPDPVAIDEMVASGNLKLKDIQDAYVETYKAPYLYLGEDT